MSAFDWHDFDADRLAEGIRAGTGGPDGEKTVWAFEQVLGAARVDEGLLEYVVVAAVCLLARAWDCSPRSVLEAFFRRSVPDELWRERYLPLFD
jgi:hypothetical protein